MSQEENTARFVLETAKARLKTIEHHRRQDGGLVSGFRLAYATAMVEAAERLLQAAQRAPG